MNEEILIPLGAFAMVVLIVYLGTRAKEQNSAMRAQVQEKLIARFNSGPELVEFLQSPSGKQFLGEAQEAPKHRAYDRILSSIRNAIVLGFLGLGFLGISFFGEHYWAMFPGFILTGLGVGFLVAAIVSNRLSRSWGIIDAPREPNNGTTQG